MCRSKPSDRNNVECFHVEPEEPIFFVFLSPRETDWNGFFHGNIMETLQSFKFNENQRTSHRIPSSQKAIIFSFSIYFQHEQHLLTKAIIFSTRIHACCRYFEVR